jgi:hypothetical protein
VISTKGCGKGGRRFDCQIHDDLSV